MDDGDVAERAEENARIRGAVEAVDVGGRAVQWNEEAWRRSVDEFEHGFRKMDAVAAMIAQLDRVKDDFIPDEGTEETVVSEEFVQCMWALLDDQASYVMGLKLMAKLVFVLDEFVELLVDTDGIARICELFRKGEHSEEAIDAFLELFGVLLEDRPESRKALLDLNIIEICMSLIGENPIVSLKAIQCLSKIFLRMNAFNNCLPRQYTIPADQWLQMLCRVREYTESVLSSDNTEFISEVIDITLCLVENQECVATNFEFPIRAGFPGLFLNLIFKSPNICKLDIIAEILLWLRYVFIFAANENLEQLFVSFDQLSLLTMCSDTPLWTDLRNRYAKASYMCTCAIFARVVQFNPEFANHLIAHPIFQHLLSVAEDMPYSAKRELAYLVSVIILALPSSQLANALTENMVSLLEMALVEVEPECGATDTRNFRSTMRAAIDRIKDAFPEDHPVHEQIQAILDTFSLT